MKWINKPTLQKGNIIRTMVGNPNHPRYGEYTYAICTDQGFGCHPNTIENAVYVKYVSFDLSEVRSKKFLDTDLNKGSVDRWERFWGIEALSE